MQELKGCILIKGKKQIPHLSQLGKNGSCASFSSSSEDELGSSNKNTPKKDPAKVSTGRVVIKPVKVNVLDNGPIFYYARLCPSQVCSKLSPELSELAVYCRSVPFRGFENVSEKPPNEMSSFSESDALRLIKDSGTAVEIIASFHNKEKVQKDFVTLHYGS